MNISNNDYELLLFCYNLLLRKDVFKSDQLFLALLKNAIESISIREHLSYTDGDDLLYSCLQATKLLSDNFYDGITLNFIEHYELSKRLPDINRLLKILEIELDIFDDH